MSSGTVYAGASPGGLDEHIGGAHLIVVDERADKVHGAIEGINEDGSTEVFFRLELVDDAS